MKLFSFLFGLVLFFPVFAQNLVPYAKKNGKFIYVDSASMTPISGKEWEQAHFFDEESNLAAVKGNKKWGFINRLESFIISPEWGYCYAMNGILFMQGNDTSSIKNSQLQELLPLGLRIDGFHMSSEAGSMISIYTMRDKEMQVAFLNQQGNLKIPFGYSAFKGSPNDGIFAVMKNNKWGLLDSGNNLIVPCLYENIESVKGADLFPVMQQSKWGFIDAQNNLVIPFNYPEAFPFSEGLSRVNLNGKWGYINKNNHVLIPFRFDAAAQFEKGLALVKEGDKYGMIDSSGKTIIPFTYTFLSGFYEDRAIFKEGNNYGFIDRNGRVVIPAQYEYVSRFSEGLCLVRNNSGVGFIDKNGNMVIPFRNYNNLSMKEIFKAPSSDWSIIISDFSHGFSSVTKNYYSGKQLIQSDLLFYMDRTGREYHE
jgi:WG containing repeat